VCDILRPLVSGRNLGQRNRVILERRKDGRPVGTIVRIELRDVAAVAVDPKKSRRPFRSPSSSALPLKVW
jgi:hypothetical protein